jgi:5-methyltetrahydrofolate--homocysteine methyltransferase
MGVKTATPPTRTDAMTDALSRLLATREWLMADGATGTNLFNMGLESGAPPEFWNTDRPENIRQLYGAAVAAGSDIFLTNTFGGNAARLKLHGAQGRVRELNRIGAELGREIADRAGRTVVVAGSVGPTGEIFEPMGTLTHAAAVEIFHEQAEGLKEGGADVLWIETISAPEEYRAAAEAAALAGMPWCGTMSFDTAGRSSASPRRGRNGRSSPRGTPGSRSITTGISIMTARPR